MSAKIKCDGCGKEKQMDTDGSNWCKPYDWFQRSDKEGIQDACSRECIEIISVETGKTPLVLPF